MKNSKEQKKCAVVTGGSSGIGLAICERFAAENYEVYNADIRSPEKNSENIRHIPCDIAEADHVSRLSGVVAQGNPPDVLVLNAGRGIHEKLREGDPEKWFEIINLNVMGSLRVLRAILPFMQKGNVIFISSVSAQNTYEYGGVYAATKSALNTIAETLRTEEQPEIGVTVISAGVVDTGFFQNSVSGIHSAESIGWGAVEPAEIAEAVMFAINRGPSAAVSNITIRPPSQPL